MKLPTIITDRRFSIQAVLGLCLFFSVPSIAQEMPPTPVVVEVSTSRFLNFGSFTLPTGAGVGSIHVDSNSNRIFSGDILLLNGQPVTSALFDVYANPGTLINIMPTQANFTLTGTNGGSMLVEIDVNTDLSTGSTFITTANSNSPNEVYIGGTLKVGNITANPPGQYNGVITINFIQQ